MNELERDYEPVLLAEHEGPCISIYQPTHRTFPDRKQDPIRFGGLLREVEASLARQHADRETEAILRPLRELAEDDQFWNHTLDGIAVFATPDLFRVYDLQRAVTEKAIVADSFHTKPLMRILQSADRYHVLGLNRHEASLFEGNRYALDPVPFGDGFPGTNEALVGTREGEPERTKRAHGPAGPGRTTRHGMNVRQASRDNDTRQFFRSVSDEVLKTYSRPSGLPLLLAALPEHHHMFREVSDNPFLMDKAINVDPASVSTEELCARAWEIVLPEYLERLERLSEQFGNARADGRGSADLTEIGKAAAAGRIATLLIDADRVVPGHLDPDTGSITYARLEDPGVDDLFDDLGEHTLKAGGDVVVVPPERMPSDTGLAAIFRF
ncbi:hypothetical protein K1T73_01655 [Roseovarius sp. SCSIO 43702]|uniref:baeRF3 domain-containing protein n=1 Tax=Roseovarius sp. SCSIO 43702 TaxID=2823043 RepID=UPI001C72EA11|nr:hypothetical protein [Roseovarius sp. SCSIO 43702]QYX57146.1 hypothetical protein K1T73_01655 [Roseovarius sp. SCSIO 43702]